ncbi:MAG TPA: hypothetical protein P5572_05430 [Phycisphaerae bacterium]|nr:hypothetical protein [Phycisphaerales bacterium]HRX84444.1 hypothetical protein [Phycisphaerae bacterium]
MSLKFFHILFVIASTLLMAMFAMWSWREYRQTHAAEDLALGIIAIVAGLALLVYGRWFLQKIKNARLA